MWLDLRFAWRQLRSAPTASLIVILTFAAGIGLNTALFSVVEALLLRALPGFETDRIVTIWERHGPVSADSVNGDTVRAWRSQAKSFERIEAGVFEPFNLTGVEPAEVVQAAALTAGYFRLYRVQAAHGRTFLPEEETSGHNHVAVLDDAFWRRKFAADPQIVGRSIRLDRQSYLVAGVLPPGFHPLGVNAVQLYVPLAMEELPAWSFWTIARLRPGVTMERARAEMSGISKGLAQSDPVKKGYEAVIVPLYEIARRDVRAGLLALFAAVGLVLLIACANIANLLLARASSRMREFATRLALGANRWRLVRQVVTESLLLAGAGGIAGLAVAWLAMRVLAAWSSGRLPRLDEVRIDAGVIAFAAAVAIAAGVLAALGPVMAVIRHDPGRTLQQGGRSIRGSREQNRWRAALVIAEIALASLLVSASSLVLQSFTRLRHADRGYDAEHLLTLSISSPAPEGADGSAEVALYRRIVERLTRLPGVQSAAMATELPIGGIGITFPVEVQGKPAPPRHSPEAQTSIITPDYFHTLRIPVLQGRAFESRDARGKQPVAIINDAVARRYFAGQNPVGQRLLFQTWDPNITRMGAAVAREIVGVVGDVRQDSLENKHPMQMYLPLEQNPISFVSVVVRTAGDTMALAPAVQREIAREDRDTPLYDIKSMDARIQDVLAATRQTTQLFSGFALMAITLAGLGTYGVLAYTVSRRTNEIGIRMALGASPARVLALVLRESLYLAAWGVGLGVAGSIASGHVLSSLLAGGQTADPLLLAAVCAGVMLLVVAAAILPARSAARVDPLTALRE
jgi:putative ABC transport system permease protein